MVRSPHPVRDIFALLFFYEVQRGRGAASEAGPEPEQGDSSVLHRSAGAKCEYRLSLTVPCTLLPSVPLYLAAVCTVVPCCHLYLALLMSMRVKSVSLPSVPLYLAVVFVLSSLSPHPCTLPVTVIPRSLAVHAPYYTWIIGYHLP